MRSSSKNISILITLLFITSQVFASASMVCDMDMSEEGMSMSGMDHTSHNMDMTNTDNTSDDVSLNDCCDINCKCSIGGCSASYTAQSSQNNIIYSQDSKPLRFKNRFFTSVEKSSLYRPPIAS